MASSLPPRRKRMRLLASRRSSTLRSAESTPRCCATGRRGAGRRTRWGAARQRLHPLSTLALRLRPRARESSSARASVSFAASRRRPPSARGRRCTYRSLRSTSATCAISCAREAATRPPRQRHAFGKAATVRRSWLASRGDRSRRLRTRWRASATGWSAASRGARR